MFSLDLCLFYCMRNIAKQTTATPVKELGARSSLKLQKANRGNPATRRTRRLRPSDHPMQIGAALGLGRLPVSHSQ
jgi:hypothetical protein